MNNRPQLSAEEVNTLLAAALAHARGQGWKVCVTVVDDGGQLLALQRDDGAAPATAHIAIAKARTATPRPPVQALLPCCSPDGIKLRQRPMDLLWPHA